MQDLIATSMLIKTIETEEGTSRVYSNRLVESFIKEHCYIDVECLIEGKKQLESIGLDKKFYFLSQAMGFFRISKEARKLSASQEYSSHIAAIAVMTNHSLIQLVIDLYNKLDKPVVPTKAFTNKDLARTWLEEMMQSEEVVK